MPLPKPRRRESQDDFISRCMADPITTRDYSRQAQRYAVCHSQWDGRRVNNMKLHGIAVNSLAGYEVRYETKDGRQHIVAPVVILVEGVHSGTAGPIFYPLEEIRDFPGSWDGRPVTLGHPSVDDSAVSAGSPEMLDQYAIGTLFHTRFDLDRRGLVSEIWVDVERARRMSKEVLDSLMAGQPLEVSTGLWYEDSGGPGIWSGESFQTTARDFRPDHLALLPGSTGACSIADGCGVRANEVEKTQEDNDMTKGFQSFLKRFVAEAEGKEEKVAANMEIFAVNKPGMLATVRALQRQLDSLDRDVPNGRLIHFLEDAYEDGTFVMRVNGPNGPDDSFFKGEFTIDGTTDEVTIGNDFTQVREQRDFVEMEAKKTQEKEAINMDSKEVLVNALIDCGQTHFAEAHREVLMSMEECALLELKAVSPPVSDNAGTEEKEETKPDSSPTVNKEEEKKEDELETTPVDNEGKEEKEEQEKQELTGLEAFIADAPEEFRGVLQDAVKANGEKKEGLVKTILGVPSNKFAEEDLQGKNIGELEALEALIGDKEDIADNESKNFGQPMGRVVNFSGRPGIDLTGNKEESPPMGRPGLADLSK